MICNETLEAIKRYKLITIVRGIDGKDVLPLAEALYEGGVRLIEVTFNQSKGAAGIEETAAAIRAVAESGKEGLLAGAGTVLSEEQVRGAAEAGARYIISPNTNPEIIRLTKQLGLVSIPGALTPSEVVVAYEAGADFVKLFPADNLGLGYAKAVMAPLNHIPMLAVGGVNEHNITDFLKAGFCGVGVGGNIVKTALVREGRFDEITSLAKAYTCQL